jgi:hypothetical protein
MFIAWRDSVIVAERCAVEIITTDCGTLGHR